jgi:Alkylmercury lyase
MTAGLEAALWRFTYETVVRTGRGPSLREGSAALGASESDIRAAYQRLGEGHAILLDPSGEALWRIAPFSAVPTDFAVEAAGRSYFANCAWDALGICAALHANGVVHASCGCCRLPMDLVVRGERLERTEGVVHIAVPAKEWYEDVTFT